MTGLAILDLVIGLIFIFFLLSIITSSAVEVVLTALRVRAKLLEEWLLRVFKETALKPDGTENTKPIKDKKGNNLKDKDGKSAEEKVKLGQAIMDHCMTTVLSPTGKSTTYIKSSDFVNAFLDQITRTPIKAVDEKEAAESTTLSNGSDERRSNDQEPPVSLQDYIDNIKATTVLEPEMRRTVLMLANEAAAAFNVSGSLNRGLTEAKSAIELFKTKLENWYDSNTERLVGELKRKWAMPFTFVVGLTVTILLNADTIAMSRYLYDHKADAKALADKAAATIGNYQQEVDRIRAADADGSKQKTLADVDSSIKHLNQSIENFKGALPASFPMGWSEPLPKESNWFTHIIGWLITVAAILLGAPFWFDLLNKIANIRGAGPKPASSIDDTKGNTTINK